MPLVMAGLLPAFQVLLATGSKDMDARHEAGHAALCRSRRRKFQ